MHYFKDLFKDSVPLSKNQRSHYNLYSLLLTQPVPSPSPHP
jgi:hypothetical protein